MKLTKLFARANIFLFIAGFEVDVSYYEDFELNDGY